MRGYRDGNSSTIRGTRGTQVVQKRRVNVANTD